MMEYVYYYDCQYYTVLAVTPYKADELFNRLVGDPHAAASATITSIKAAA